MGAERSGPVVDICDVLDPSRIARLPSKDTAIEKVVSGNVLVKVTFYISPIGSEDYAVHAGHHYGLALNILL